MSDSTPTPARSGADVDRSRRTGEDSGSTMHADLFENDTTGGVAGVPRRGDVSDRAVADAPTPSAAPSEPAVPAAPSAPEAPIAPSGGLGALAGEDSVGHVFDQTNGVIDRLDGDSDGTAESDVLSSAERADENPAFERFADTEVSGISGADEARVMGD